MAYVAIQYCHICEEDKMHTNGKCPDCTAKAYRQQTAAWNAQTLEEQIQDLRKRVERLENRRANDY